MRLIGEAPTDSGEHGTRRMESSRLICLASDLLACAYANVLANYANVLAIFASAGKS